MEKFKIVKKYIILNTWIEHFLTIVNNMLDTFSAKNGRDQVNTLSPSGSLYGGSVAWYYLSYKLPSSNIKIDPLLS